MSRVLGTRVDVGRVSFSPLDAIVTLRNVVVHPPDGGARDSEAKHAITAKRVHMDIQWLPLLHRSLVMRQLMVETGRVDLERLRAAGWTLERLQDLAPTSELPRGWSFVLDRIALRDMVVRVRGGGARDAAALDLTVHEARMSTQRPRVSAFGRVPNLRVDAVVDGGRVLIDGSSDIRDDGVAINARIHVKDVPLRAFAAYPAASLPRPAVAGRVSGRLHYQRDPGRRERVTGRLRGRRFAVRVPTLIEPALAVRRVDAEVVGVDLLQRRIAIETLTLHGTRLAVRPDLAAPVPLLDGLALDPAPSPNQPRPTRRPGRWGWTIGHLAAPSTRLFIADAGEERTLAASVSGDSIGPAAYWSPLRATIGWEGGSAMFDGTVRTTRGVTVEGRLTANDVDAALVAHAVGPPLGPLVRTGRVAADLDVELALSAVDGPPLDVRGKVSVAGLSLVGEEPNAFVFDAQAVDLTLARIGAAKGAGPQAVEIELSTAVLVSPHLALARLAPAASAEAAIQATGSEPEGPVSTLTLAMADVSVQDGQLLVVDQTAAPTLSLDLTAVDGWMRDLRLPAVGVGDFDLQGTESRLGVLRLSSARSGDELRAELSAPDFGLSALTPYFQRAGLPYAFTGGRGAVRSVLLFTSERWNADTTLTLLEPTLGGDEGMLQRSLGMVPAAALAAVHDRHGEVMLRLPLASPERMDARQLTETFARGVREALARPRWVPLPEAPIAIAFAPGLTEPGPDTARQLATIAEILAARPDVVLELRGVISRQDRRWFAEQAVAAARADEPGGFGVLWRAFGVRDQRTRIQEALGARRTGQPGRLDPKDEAALGALVAAATPIPDDRLTRLAAARATIVATLLAERHGVVAARVVAAEPTVPESAAAVVDARLLPNPGMGPR